jgi:hypothetical protein
MKHYVSVDPSSEWKRGWIGHLIKWHGLAFSGLVDIVGSGLLLWFTHWSLSLIALAAGVFLICWLLTVRHYSLQRLESDQSLHAFFHQSRDDIARLPPPGDPEYRRSLDWFHRNTAQRLAKFFRERTGDKAVNCAIRLAQAGAEQEEYATVARSEGMDVSRQDNTVPIPSNKGLALALREGGQVGVYIIRDISKEVGGALWFGTKNDALPDVRALMAAPINGWDDGTKAMLGILYVTSPKDIFEPGDTLPLKALADYLGLVYPMVLGKLGG